MLSLSDNVPTGDPGMCLMARLKCVLAKTTLCSMGFARLAESTIRDVRGKGKDEKLGALDKILASSIGGALATWNQPIEVVRVEVSVQPLSSIFMLKTRVYSDAINVEICKHCGPP